MKERKAASEIKEIDARSVQIGVQAAYSAMQAGAQVAQVPQIAPIADIVMQGAGYQRPNPIGDDPQFDGNELSLPVDKEITSTKGSVRKNTSPEFPPIPNSPKSSMTGIETSNIEDNLN